MIRAVLAAAAIAVLLPQAFAETSCPLTLEGRWIDDASSNIKGKPNQVTGFILRRQGEGYYLTTIYDFGARGVPRGLFKGGPTTLVTERVLGLDDLTIMFQGTVVGPIAVNELATLRPTTKRIYTLSADGNTVEVSGDTPFVNLEPDGRLRSWRRHDLTFKSARAAWPKPCEGVKRAAEWETFKAKANAWRDAKDKPALTDEIRQHGMMGVDAVNAKNFDAALEEFETGLAKEPLWPNGHFNAAMVYAQMGDFENAIYHMKAYLELCPPDEKDLQANKDRVLLWQGKLKQQMAEAPQPVPEE